MKKQIEKLIETMETEIELMTALKTSLNGQKEYVLGSRAEQFIKCIYLIEDLLNNFKVKDLRRIEILDSIGLELKIKEQLTITELLKHLPFVYKSRLKKLRDEFVSLNDDIKVLNIENRFLIKKAYVFVQNSLKTFKHFTKNDFVYSVTGGYGNISQPVNRILDRSM